jgi:hypothetical protein
MAKTEDLEGFIAMIKLPSDNSYLWGRSLKPAPVFVESEDEVA